MWGQDLPAGHGVGAVEAEHDGRADVHPVERLEHPVRHLVHPGDPAEDVDEDGADGRIGVDHLEGGGHHVGVGPAADVEEVGGRATALVDHVEGAHGQSGAVGDDPHRPVQADVVEAALLGPGLALVLDVAAGELLPFGMAEGGVVVEGDLGVEGSAPGRPACRSAG